MNSIRSTRCGQLGLATHITGPRPPYQRRQLVTAASAHTDAASVKQGKTIILYSKPNCPLCEGTRDRVQGLIDRAQFMPSALMEYTLEVRDISKNPAWRAAYELEVPLLTALTVEGREVRIPRPPPRMTTDKLRQHIEAALPH
ncbi:hypothetical protein Vretimale_9968 [Volvox reticuliferus]|uniref:Glutaredoxin-like protein n=1 Tax=Volvox reticuliferus TaxID=1737510 RepID=A0A8J4LQH3_9CHLO|nr:hypothetical protein Vretifemale_13739 [Volvox reticuliferus]GIM05481.1 hypothetical protein Vretimale_9968 [Volvox reticuliferus]